MDGKTDKVFPSSELPRSADGPRRVPGSFYWNLREARWESASGAVLAGWSPVVPPTGQR